MILYGSAAPYDGDPEGGYEAKLQAAEGPVEPCEPVRADHRAMFGAPKRPAEGPPPRPERRRSYRLGLGQVAKQRYAVLIPELRFDRCPNENAASRIDRNLERFCPGIRAKLRGHDPVMAKPCIAATVRTQSQKHNDNPGRRAGGRVATRTPVFRLFARK